MEDLRPGDTEKGFIRGTSAPKSSPLSIYTPFLIEEVPYWPSIDKWFPLLTYLL